MESKKTASCVVHVCTSCRPAGSPRGLFEERPGYKLYKALQSKVHDSVLKDVVNVQPAECLSVCPRPCGIAISSPGLWTYLFGDQELPQSVEEIVECLSHYLSTSDGFMSRLERPKGMRRSILGRVPPIGGSNASV